MFFRLFERPFMTASAGMGAHPRQEKQGGTSISQPPPEQVSDPAAV
jgi:hypothetical protein